MTENLCKVPNRLIKEKSPYLLQHANNPVDWFPWGDEAFEKARAEDKPIFLSIGYSTCHWCHVMERESFDDKQVAEILNRHFIAVKVDREERPDIDAIYMSFCQAMTGGGGWPLTIVMTPEGKPFFAGTYFPKLPGRGQQGLLDLLGQIHKAWHGQREEILESGGILVAALKKAENSDQRGVILADITDRTFRYFERAYDPIHGGFGREPKFPMPHILFFLLRYYLTSGNKKALKMVLKTLDNMYKGGIFDHIGYGFSRYSTDAKWLVPHFEKMLYDNALLALAYMEAFTVTGKERYKVVSEKILNYVLRDMTNPGGGFYSAEDADSEGEEGRFYLFDANEIDLVLGEASAEFKKCYDITESGNFEGRNIPNLIVSGLDAVKSDAETAVNLEESRRKLMAYRERRPRPFRDDKILTSWNGLMIAALAFAGRVTGKGDYIEAASKAAEFIIKNAINDKRRLLSGCRDGEGGKPGYVDDYAFLIWGLTELYESTLDNRWLDKAAVLARDMIRLFWDSENGGLFLYGSDAEELLLKPKNIVDGALPSGNSVAAQSLLRLAALTEDEYFLETADALLRAFGSGISKNPSAHIHLVTAYLYEQTGVTSILISGSKDDPETLRMLNIVKNRFFPFAVYRYEEEPGKAQAVAIICRNNFCRAPVTDSKTFEVLMNSKY